jgi:tetratricopeptide (TPR) repeat protein
MTEQPFQTVSKLRKAGSLNEAADFGFAALEQNPKDSYLQSALFWVCYAQIKLQQQKITERAKKNANNYRPQHSEFEQIQYWLDTSFQLGFPLGGTETKWLLILFKNILPYFPTMMSFVLDYHDQIFDLEARTPFQAEKAELPSLMLSMARDIAKAWLSPEYKEQLDVQQVLTFINCTRSEVLDKNHKMWLDYDQAKCLIALGAYEQAQRFLQPIVRKKHKDAWAWHALGQCYQASNLDLALKLLAKAVVEAIDDKQKVKPMTDLARALYKKQQIQEASMCLKVLAHAYEANQWQLSPKIQQAMTQTWFDEQVDEKELMPYLKNLSHDADEILYGESKTVVGVVESIHKSKKGFQVFVSKKLSYSVHIKKHQNKKVPHSGDYVALSVAINEQQEEVICSKPSKPIQLNDVSTIEGQLQKTNKGFGFINQTFVPSFLIGNHNEGSSVSALTVQAWDKAKSRYSPKAIKIWSQDD